jgi:hypothetical protein
VADHFPAAVGAGMLCVRLKALRRLADPAGDLPNEVRVGVWPFYHVISEDPRAQAARRGDLEVADRVLAIVDVVAVVDRRLVDVGRTTVDDARPQLRQPPSSCGIEGGSQVPSDSVDHRLGGRISVAEQRVQRAAAPSWSRSMWRTLMGLTGRGRGRC